MKKSLFAKSGEALKLKWVGVIFDQEWFVTICGQQRNWFIKKLYKKAKASIIKITYNQKIEDLITLEFSIQQIKLRR